MEDVRLKGEEVHVVSMGLDGDWFLRTDTRHGECTAHKIASLDTTVLIFCLAAKTIQSSPDLITNVEIFLNLAEQCGLDLRQYMIDFFTFVPDPTGYVALLMKDDGSTSRCAWRNVPAELDRTLERVASLGVQHVTVGSNGGFVIMMNDGTMWWHNIPASLETLLDDAEKRGRRVAVSPDLLIFLSRYYRSSNEIPIYQTVHLSLLAESWYYLAFADGTVEFSLPAAWHNAIQKHTAHLRHSMATAYHSSPSQSPSYSPPPGYAGTNAYTGYGSPYGAGMQYSPPPMYGGFSPQPAPTYNYTNIFGAAPPQKDNNMKGTFEVLGGALKVGAAVLNLAGGGGFTGGFGFN